MGGLMNKYDLGVCDNSRSEVLLSTSTLFYYQSLNQTKSLLTSNDPTGCLSHYTEKMRRNRGQENLLKLAIKRSVSLILAVWSYTAKLI